MQITAIQLFMFFVVCFDERVKKIKLPKGT